MQIQIKRSINAPVRDLWPYLADYSNIQRFNPMLKDSHFIEGANTCEVGSKRQCVMKDGGYIKEEVTEWKDGSHYTVDIYESSMPLKSAKATLGLNRVAEGRAEAYMSIEMEPKYSILRPLMYVMYKFMAGPAILKGLDRLYHTEHHKPKTVNA